MLEQETSWSQSQRTQRQQGVEAMAKAKERHSQLKVLEANSAFKGLLLGEFLGSELEDLREKIDYNELHGKVDTGLRQEYLGRVTLRRYFEKIAKNAETATVTLGIIEDRNNADQGNKPQPTDNGWD